MDYFFKTTNLQSFLEDLQLIQIEINMNGDFYQDQQIIIECIREIPNVVDPNSQYVNVRTEIELDYSQFKNTIRVYPDPPYRVFS